MCLNYIRTWKASCKITTSISPGIPNNPIKTTLVDGNPKYDVKYAPTTTCDKIITEKHEYHEIFSSVNLANYICLDVNASSTNPEEFYINEFWGNDGFKMLQIEFNLCEKSSGKCASEKEITKHIDNQIITVYAITNYVDTTNHDKPFIHGVHDKF